MVLLLEKLVHALKPSSKMDHHHHHQNHNSQPLMASLQAFQSHVSNDLNQLSSNSQPNSPFLSLTHIHQCLDLISIVNKGFAKLVMAIDYPMAQWDEPFIDEYLNHSLDLLELLNSISSSISQLSHSRLLLSHALTLVENSPSLAIEHLKPIMPKSTCSKGFKEESKRESREQKRSSDTEKVWVVQQALLVMKNACLEMKNYANSSFGAKWVVEEEKGVWKEAKEVNDAVACLVSAMGRKEGVDGESRELKRRLEVFEKLLNGVGKCSDHLFSEVLAARNELLDCLRQKM